MHFVLSPVKLILPDVLHYVHEMLGELDLLFQLFSVPREMAKIIPIPQIL